jgi:integrase
MIYYRNNGIGVKLIRKKVTRDDLNERRIYWQITYKRKSVLYFTGNSFTEEEWDDIVQKQLRKHKNIKDTFQRYFDKTLRPVIDNFAENNSFTFEALETTLMGESNQTISVNKAFQNKIDQLKNEYKIGNASIYKTTYNALMRFKHYKSLKNNNEREAFITLCIKKKNITVGKNALSITEEIKFKELTPQFLNDCEKFWVESEISYATIGMYMRTLRAIINNSEGEEPFLSGKEYPFGIKRGKYMIPEGGRREIALPIEDIWRIENYETDNPAIAAARDIFVFMFYCNGLNFGDLCRLRYENIDAPTGEIVFQRKKTLRKKEKPTYIYVPILLPMVEIINRQGNKNQDGYIFSFLNGIEPIDNNENKIINTTHLALDQINSSLKLIAKELELDPDLSTSYTRNSYISHLVGELLVNPIVVRKMVGHSTKKDVTAGYVNLTAKKRSEINSKLLNPNKKYSSINSGREI